jgi:hypothetical protein
MSINLHIERLILDGVDFGPLQRQQLRTAVEEELVRLFGGDNVAQNMRSGAVPSISSAPIELHNSPAEFGRQIAGSVFGGIGR